MKVYVMLAVFVLMLIGVSESFASDFLRSADEDLNGDGETEHISLSESNVMLEFRLSVGPTSTKGTLVEGCPDGFLVIDLDEKDQHKEIAVHTPGPSDDDEYLLYGYSGKSIYEIARLSRWPEFLGNGIVLLRSWSEFWLRTDKYVLDRDKRTLEFVPQELYYVGVQVQVKERFPIYQTRAGKRTLATLEEKEEVLVLLCDASPGDEKFSSWWYCIKSASGLIGWAKYDSFRMKVEGLPLAD